MEDAGRDWQASAWTGRSLLKIGRWANSSKSKTGLGLCRPSGLQVVMRWCCSVEVVLKVGKVREA